MPKDFISMKDLVTQLCPFLRVGNKDVGHTSLWNCLVDFDFGSLYMSMFGRYSLYFKGDYQIFEF